MSRRYYNTSIRNLEYRLRRFKENLHNTLADIVQENADIIISTVTADQLYDEGIDGRGIRLDSFAPYTLNTQFRKVRKGQPIDRVTLRDTGEFYNSIYLVFDKGGFYLTSSDDKFKHLKKKYGPRILRLTNENLSYILDEVIRPELAKRLKEAVL